MSGQVINPPDLDDLFVAFKNEIFATLNCIQIGKIEAVNDNQTVSIQLQFKRRLSGGKTSPYPVLVDCPYVVLQGGGAYIDMPINTGDFCLVLFNDRNIDDWWDTANVKEPRDRRKHSISDGIALVGINPNTSFLEKDGSLVRILGTSGPGDEEFAARQNDKVTSDSSTDINFWTFFAAVWAVFTGPSIPEPGAGNPSALQTAVAAAITGAGGAPTSQVGKITGGSEEVKIG